MSRETWLANMSQPSPPTPTADTQKDSSGQQLAIEHDQPPVARLPIFRRCMNRLGRGFLTLNPYLLAFVILPFGMQLFLAACSVPTDLYQSYGIQRLGTLPPFSAMTRSEGTLELVKRRTGVKNRSVEWALELHTPEGVLSFYCYLYGSHDPYGCVEEQYRGLPLSALHQQKATVWWFTHPAYLLTPSYRVVAQLEVNGRLLRSHTYARENLTLSINRGYSMLRFSIIWLGVSLLISLPLLVLVWRRGAHPAPSLIPRQEPHA
ncbi:TPA: hypothetical protein RQN76_003859 [Aeromonas dhakensis]|nr:hypothetical protein [Aeromonas dhakensis]